MYLPDLELALAAVYRGSLEEFVARRDQLVKQLRAGKRREDAERAKALRKPNKLAWALDCAVHENADAFDRLLTAVNAAAAAQTGGGGDVRRALEDMRSAVRAFAADAARAAAEAGQTVDANALTPAVMAVLGDANAFAELRAGRLADIPESGGLDFLASVVPPTPPVLDSEKAAQEAAEKARLAAIAEAELRRAQEMVARCAEEVESARERLRLAESKQTEAQAVLDSMRARASK